MSRRDEAMHAFFELHSEEAVKVVRECLSGEHSTQPWAVIPAGQFHHLLGDFSKTGHVRNERLLDNFAQQVIRNVARLDVNTELMGHSAGTIEDYEEILSESGYDADLVTFSDVFADFCTDQESGQWRISDYAMEKLVELAIDLLAASTSTEKLLLIDRVMNVCHQRSDLSAWFVEGGSETLTRIAA